MVKKLLCGVDNTEQSNIAIALAAKLAKAFGAELTLIAVNELVGGYGKGGGSDYLWEEDEMKRVLDNASAAAKDAGVANAKTASAASRDVARAIVMYAEDNGIDHIVVGTGGKSGISRLMLGSVSRDVVFRAHCPVTVAR